MVYVYGFPAVKAPAEDYVAPSWDDMLFFRGLAVAFLLLQQVARIWATGPAVLPAIVGVNFALLNVADEFVGRPGHLEPHEYIIGAGILIYETVKYYRRRKNEN